ncbi:hypothetical protein SGL43_02580 [Streptomyces globisporus]|uniref:Uncharacterized protein n=1 Tax=Streptomyces globisporus TaxID=1908 RepID=A0ABM9GVI6_STRGL|nr:hypothetical protein SGL43_02580 [Streptomyces globisporus]
MGAKVPACVRIPPLGGVFRELSAARQRKRHRITERPTGL